MTHAACDFLSSSAAQVALEAESLPARNEELAFLSRLRKQFGAEEAGWLLGQLRLRERAAGRIPGSAKLLFDDEALSMLSAGPVAAWRAGRIAGHAQTCLDLGAGIGGDCLALARAGLEVHAVECDSVRARLLSHNLRACGFAERVSVHAVDWTTHPWPTAWSQAGAAFVDPARRVEGKRVLSLHAMQPPIAAILERVEQLPAAWVKVAPGFDLRELPAAAGLEFVSLGGELKEALLTFGAARRRGPRAVVLPAGAELVPNEPPAPQLGPPGELLYDPDPAVIRAGLVRTLGVQLGAHQFDPQTAYLSGPARETPFARGWPIERWGPFSLKLLKRWLREAKVGRLEIKRRRSPIEPATLLRQIGKLKGVRSATVFLTPVEEKPAMLLSLSPAAKG